MLFANVTDVTYGAVGDGITDDTPAIQSAIDAVILAGAGVVYFPAGTYLLASNNPVETGMFLVADGGDNVFFRGEGRGVSILTVANGGDGSVVEFENMVGGGISGLEINGNRAHTTGGHGIRSGGNLTDFVISDMYIHDMFSYGIGLQVGDLVNVTIDRVVIENTGLDGIDVKNGTNGNSQGKMSNITVRRAGLRTDVTGQTCIDIRGPWKLVNIDCVDFNDTAARCTTGVRFRFGETTDPTTGYGGHFSSLTNAFIKPSSVSGTIGVDMSAQKCQVSNVYVEDAGTAYYITQQENVVSNCVANGGGDGFMFMNVGLTTDANRCIATGCLSRGNSSYGFYVESDNVLLTGIIARSNTTKGVKIASTANQTVVSGLSQSNSGGNLLNSGTNSVTSGLIIV